ncbi:MAG: hypothetical protein ACR2ND_04210 [Solirubrobacteraceae bacterium]
MGTAGAPGMTAPLCVAYLVHARNGLEPVQRFLRSYGDRSAGVEHEFVLLLKGFAREEHACEHLALAGSEMRTLLVPSAGYDLTAYWHAAARLAHDRVCFLNSFSEILADNWLSMLTSPLDDSSIGVVGSSGSWASQRGYAAYQLGLPTHYAAAFPSRHDARMAFLEIDGRTSRGRLLHKAGTALDYIRRLRGFDPFPAPHLRTNAFAARRELLAQIVLPPIRGKLDAHRFESGRPGMTAQVHAMGLRCTVVGRDGAHYGPGDWPSSRTFSQGAQENLLVADNRTNLYAAADARGRQYLSWLAWGERALPG